MERSMTFKKEEYCVIKKSSVEEDEQEAVKNEAAGVAETPMIVDRRVSVKREVITIDDDEYKESIAMIKDDEVVEEVKKELVVIEDDDEEPTKKEDDMGQVAARSDMPSAEFFEGFKYRDPKGLTSAIRSIPSPSTILKRKHEAISEDECPNPSSAPLTTATSSAITTVTTTATSVRTSSARVRARRRVNSGYAPPSTYEHLNLLPDVIEPSLICLFVGLNPGLRTAEAGHAYSHPSNLFWKLLHSSGCTTRRLAPQEDRDLPRLFGLGNTNIVARPTRNQAELSRDEMVESVRLLEDKIRLHRPEAVCLVGKAIWEAVWKAKYGRALRPHQFSYCWQDARENMGRCFPPHHHHHDDDDPSVKSDPDWQGARVFVATSTSGLAASTTPAEKEDIWRVLGDWVSQRRAERAT